MPFWSFHASDSPGVNFSNIGSWTKWPFDWKYWLEIDPQTSIGFVFTIGLTFSAQKAAKKFGKWQNSQWRNRALKSISNWSCFFGSAIIFCQSFPSLLCLLFKQKGPLSKEKHYKQEKHLIISYYYEESIIGVQPLISPIL